MAIDNNTILQDNNLPDSSHKGLRSKIDSLIKSVNDGLFDKEDIVKISVLAVLAGQNIFLYGPPGTAKSMVSRKIAKMFKESNYFEHLLHRFCTPEELFGPISLIDLKNDIYNRKLEGYLADADFAFLDEIWKSSPAVLNTLLTLINEHKYHNGNTIIDTPMKSLISASNEIPLADDGLSALYDRFLVRLVVNPIKEIDVFKNLIIGLSGKKIEKTYPFQISNDQYKSWLEEINDVRLSEECADAICYMRLTIDKYLEEKAQAEIDDLSQNDYADSKSDKKNSRYRKLSYISDRRWLQTIKLIKASAFYNGQSETLLKDLMVLKHALWSEVDEIESFENLVIDAIEGQLKVSSSKISSKILELEGIAKEILNPKVYLNEHLRVKINHDNQILVSYIFETKLDIESKVLLNYDDLYSTKAFANGAHITTSLVQSLINDTYLKHDIIGKEVNTDAKKTSASSLKEGDLIKIKLIQTGIDKFKYVPELGCGVVSYTIANDTTRSSNSGRSNIWEQSFATVFLPSALYQILNQVPIEGIELYAKVASYDKDKSRLKLKFNDIFKETLEPEKNQRVEFCDRVVAIYNYYDKIEGSLIKNRNEFLKQRIKSYSIDEKILKNDIKIAITLKGDFVVFNEKINNSISKNSNIHYVNDNTDCKGIYWDQKTLNCLFRDSVEKRFINEGSVITINPKGKYIFNYENLNCICAEAVTYNSKTNFDVLKVDYANNILILKQRDEMSFDGIWIDYNHILSPTPNIHQIKVENTDIEYSCEIKDGTHNSKLFVITKNLEDKEKSVSFNISEKLLSNLAILNEFIPEINELEKDIESLEEESLDKHNKEIDIISSDLFIGEHDKNELSEIYTKKYLASKELLTQNKKSIQNLKNELYKLAL